MLEFGKVRLPGWIHFPFWVHRKEKFPHFLPDKLSCPTLSNFSKVTNNEVTFSISHIIAANVIEI